MMGWIFLWPFLDKVFGLGVATEKGSGWVDDGSPTFGFLEFATKDPFKDVFQPLAGNAVADWMFMLGLRGVGLALTLGIAVRFGAVAGATMLLLMYAASAIWPEHNPFLDEHLVYAVILIGLATTNVGRTMGFGRLWERTRLVNRYRFLR